MTDEGFTVDRIRLFRSDFMERFTVVTPAAFALTWLVLLSAAFYVSWGVAGHGAWAMLVLGGLLFWTLFEYAMHRFVFHMKLTSRWGKRIIYLTHGNHHVVANDPYRNIMPPLVSMAICGTVCGVILLLLGSLGLAVSLGFLIGYVIYDIVHYACHQVTVRHPLLKALQRHHSRHHYARHEGNYAITAIFWDRVFGTVIPEKARDAA